VKEEPKKEEYPSIGGNLDLGINASIVVKSKKGKKKKVVEMAAELRSGLY
jgi:hypothetical protein